MPAAQDTIPAPRSTATIRSWPVPCLQAQVKTSPPPIRTCFASSSGLCQEPLHHMPSWQQRERRRPVRRLPISTRAAQIITTLARGYSRPDRPTLQSIMQVSLSRDEWATFTNSCLTNVNHDNLPDVQITNVIYTSRPLLKRFQLRPRRSE